MPHVEVQTAERMGPLRMDSHQGWSKYAHYQAGSRRTVHSTLPVTSTTLPRLCGCGTVWRRNPTTRPVPMTVGGIAMSILSLRLPESLHQRVSELATKESISINQFITTAVAEKMAALLTEEYLEERVRRADPAASDRILARVPDVPPVPGDEREPSSVSRAANCSLPALRMTRADSPTSVMALYAGFAILIL